MSGCNLISQVCTCVQELDHDVILTKHVAYFFISIELSVASVRFTALELYWHDFEFWRL